MDTFPLARLIGIRRFPAVVHPRHARELLAGGEGLAEWTAGYAITVPEHRQMLEDLLGALCWHQAGQAVLVNGLYGTGKSHLLVLLHLLCALPEAWTHFLDAHPAFLRYAVPMQGRRRLVVHFSLDEYGPRVTLEDAVGQEVTRSLAAAGLPAEWRVGASRLDDWAGLLERLRAHGYDGLVLLTDEISLFLAGRSPAKREADAAFLQFLAGWAARAPVWLIGALQRNLGDVGALKTHSWRQVEDRFRRYTLSPQAVGSVLREKLVCRLDLGAVRALVSERIVPAAVAQGLPGSAGDWQTHWPFHPQALDLFMAVANGHLSPHRSAVDVLQRLGEGTWLDRPADRLITPLDLFSLVADELKTQPRLEPLWRVVAVLKGRAAATPDPALAERAVALLVLLHLAERTATVDGLRALLFDGTATPDMAQLFVVLHALRRRGAHLTAVRDADPGRETFCLVIDDEVGVLADLRMQELRQEFTPDDPRVVELAWSACREEAWPLTQVAEGARVAVPWCGGERAVLLATAPALTEAAVVRAFESLAAGKVDGAVFFGWPGADAAPAWHAATVKLPEPDARALCLWLPRALRPAERDLLADYAAWQRAATEPLPPATPRDRRVRQRCTEGAEELRPAVAAVMHGLFAEGHWVDARGDEGTPPREETLTVALAGLLASGFAARFPAFPSLAAGGVPSRAALQQLMLHFIEPGEIYLDPQSLLGDYLDRFALPLGCTEVFGATARVAPPRTEILEVLEALTADRPARTADALEALRRPPLGLTPEQARLAVFAAVRVGALQGLDAFLQPLDPDTVPIAHSDAVAFVGPPATAELRFRPLVHELAEFWHLVADPWPLACSQVERRLRGWLKQWVPRVASLREALAAWSEAWNVPPWAWVESQRALAALEHLDGMMSLDDLLAALTDSGLRPAVVETLGEATAWWTAQSPRLRVLCAATDEDTRAGLVPLAEALITGEACLPRLGTLGEAVAVCWEAYREAYRAWHDATFGPAVVAALREAFDSPAFRAVKLLVRLPLAPPVPAQACLDALAQARARYCPGLFLGVETDGACAKCRLPLGNPSPMPDADAVRREADAALVAYAELLAMDPWADTVRARLPRAPRELAPRVDALLTWRASDGPYPLLETLDDRLLAWLTRDASPAARRRVDALRDRLTDRDLTLAEARDAVHDWLDPERTLGDDAVVRFE